MSTTMGALRGKGQVLKKPVAQRVLPLRLAPIDSFFLTDDRLDYPMTFTSHLTLTGEVDREAFEIALKQALIHHPILAALVKPIKANQPCWGRVEGVKPLVRWGRLGDPWSLPLNREAFDLGREAGLRVWVHVGRQQSEILLQFHHACCDGTGAYRFIGDLLAQYGVLTAATEATRPQPEACDPQLLRTRRTKMITGDFDESYLRMMRRGLRHARNFFGQRVAPLAEGRPDPHRGRSALADFPGVMTLSFDREEHRLLRSAAGDAGVMLNDLLIAEMFRTICQWNHDHGRGGRERFRIMMPTDLREKEHILMPAANMTSYSFLTRTARQCRGGAELLKSVRDETARIKNEKQGKQFIDAVMLSENVPGLLRFLLNQKRCLATVILSNVGDPTRRFLARFPRDAGRVLAGNLRLEEISGVPPLRYLSRATLSVVTYGRDLAIHMRCDPAALSEADTCELLELYGQRLRGYF